MRYQHNISLTEEAEKILGDRPRDFKLSTFVSNALRIEGMESGTLRVKI